jgi:hypothetical protein
MTLVRAEAGKSIKNVVGHKLWKSSLLMHV